MAGRKTVIDQLMSADDSGYSEPVWSGSYGSLTRAIESILAWKIWGHRWAIWLAIVLSAIPILVVVTTPLSLAWQAAFGFGGWAVAMWIRRFEGHLVSLIMMMLSVIVTARYMYWRISETLGLTLPTVGTWDLFFALGLLFAELYALVVLLLGYVQLAWPLHRKPVRLPDDPAEWPTVDIYVPTYNEPMNVVRPTVLAALEMDWPADKMKVYILDDGERDEFGEFAREVGAIHLPRAESTHAKAGNINKALTMTDGDLITIFDCDHIPCRSFLQVSLGWFLKDSKLAVVQLPHHFFSPDPFERNLGTFRIVPNEGELFYGLLQDGNDFWNATFFCGSCAVLKREAILQVNGIAVETVTEDAHTALKMHRLGWTTAYINIPQAAGLATEALSGHVGQRIRWARGMAQIFRVDNPILKRGLTFGQRVCYTNAMFHFFYGLPRMIFLTAPLSYLFFEAHIIQASALMIAAYALPHLAHAGMTNSRLQGTYRHSFWAEVYETVLAYYIFTPTLLAIINPKLGSFNVTEKGGIVDNTYFDDNIARPYLILLWANVIGLTVGFFRLFWWNAHEIDTVILNMIWTVYNLIIIGASLAVAWEARQVRKAIRVETRLGAIVQLPGGRNVACETSDLSESGVRLVMPTEHDVETDSHIRVHILPTETETWLPTRVVRSAGKVLCLEFRKLELEEEKHLLYCIFGRADAWVTWAETREADLPGRAFREVMSVGYRGVTRFVRYASKRFMDNFIMTIRILFGIMISPRSVASTAAMFLIAGAALVVTAQVQAQSYGSSNSATLLPRGNTNADGVNTHTLSLQELGVQRPIRLRGVQGEISIPLSVRDDEIVTRARMKLRFSHSPSLLFDISHLNVLVNNELVATMPLSKETAAGSTAQFDIDPRLFLEYNQIILQLIASYTGSCQDPSHTSLWAIVSNKSTLEFDTKPLELQDDLNLLPQPFFDSRDARKLVLPFVFGSEPTLEELEAAGVIASWYGAIASYRGASFPVMIDELPDGHAVVFSSGGRAPSGVDPALTSQTAISMVTHPSVPSAKLLVVSGTSGAELNMAARALTLGSDALSGTTTKIREMVEPAPRKPYDAPRWVPTDRPVAIGELADARDLQVSGLYPDLIRVNFSVPPDLFTWRSDGLPIDIKYRYTPTVAGKSTLNVNINDEFVEAIPLGHTDEGDASVNKIQLPFLPDYDAVNNKTVFVPEYKVSNANQLQFHYFFERKKEGACKDVILDNLRGVIDEDSTIDLSAFPHYTALPELALFASGGFPFTRMADLSETVIVLPDTFSREEIESYLMVMGRFGNATGYPGIRFKLVRAAGLSQYSDRDILVIGTAGNQPLLEQWASEMPVSVVGGETQLRVIGPIERLRAKWDGRDIDAAIDHAGRVVLEAGRSLSAMMSIRSPLDGDRVAVIITAGNPERLRAISELLQQPGKSQFIRGDLALLNGDEINNYLLGRQFWVGSLPFMMRLRWWMSSQPVILLVLLVVSCLILAVVLYRILRRMAAARKLGEG